MLTLIVILVSFAVVVFGALSFGFDTFMDMISIDLEQAEHDQVLAEMATAAQLWYDKQAMAQAASEANKKAMLAVVLSSPRMQATLARAKAATANRPRTAGRMAL